MDDLSRATSELQKVLMQRDGKTLEEADSLIRDAAHQVAEGANPDDVLMDEFGLEPDYTMDLIEYLM